MKNILMNEITEGTIFGLENCTCDKWICVEGLQENKYIEFENSKSEKIQFTVTEETEQFINYRSCVIPNEKHSSIGSIVIDKETNVVLSPNLFELLIDLGVAVESMDILTDMYRGFEYLEKNKNKLKEELEEYVEVCLLTTGSLKSFMDAVEYFCGSEEKMRTVMTASWDMILEILELNWEYEYLEEILEFRKRQK